jgi:hypothetical protein
MAKADQWSSMSSRGLHDSAGLAIFGKLFRNRLVGEFLHRTRQAASNCPPLAALLLSSAADVFPEFPISAYRVLTGAGWPAAKRRGKRRNSLI